jgi:hypothetical protein
VLKASATVKVKSVPSATLEEKPVQANDKQETDVSPSTTKFRYPRPADYDQIVAKAKQQKKGAVSFIQKHTQWTLIQGRTGTDRKDWAV